MKLTTAGALGAFGAAAKLAAVVFLQEQPHTYKIEAVQRWAAEALADPDGTRHAAFAFTAGLAALAAFFWALGDGAHPRLRAGARLAAVGALLNAAGTMAPAAALFLANADAMVPWLAMTLYLDATFNLCLGGGLVLIASVTWTAATWSKPLSILGLVGGLLSMVVSLQAVSDSFATLLVVSGPLWILWIVWVSLAFEKLRFDVGPPG